LTATIIGFCFVFFALKVGLFNAYIRFPVLLSTLTITNVPLKPPKEQGLKPLVKATVRFTSSR
jgi:hypothetical protein